MNKNKDNIRKEKEKKKNTVDCHKLDGIIRLFIDNA